MYDPPIRGWHVNKKKRTGAREKEGKKKTPQTIQKRKSDSGFTFFSKKKC